MLNSVITAKQHDYITTIDNIVDKTITIFYSNSSLNYFSQILQSFYLNNNAVQITELNFYNSSTFPDNTADYVIILTSTSSIRINENFVAPRFNLNSKLWIFLHNDFKLKTDYVCKEFLNIYWRKLRLINMLITVFDSEIMNKYEYCTWFPYQYQQCKHVINVTMIHDLESFDYNKKLVDFNKCPIKIFCHFNNRAVLFLFSEVVDKYNARYHLVQPQQPETFLVYKSEDGSYGDGLRYLLNDELDLILVLQPWDEERSAIVDSSTVIERDELQWIVPTWDPLDWKMFVTCFSKSMWAFVLISGLSIFLFLCCYNIDISNNILTVIKIYLSIGSPFPDNKMKSKYIMISISLCFLTITSLYQSILYSNLVKLEQRHTYDNMEQVFEDDVKFYMLARFKSMYNQSDHEFWGKVYSRKHEFVFIDDLTLFYQMDEYKNVTVLLFSKLGNAYIPFFRDDNSRYTLHKIPSKITYYSVFYFAPKSPFLKPFNRAFNQLVEGGIYQKWDEDKSGQIYLSNFNALQPISLHKLKPIFLLLLIGLFSSFLILTFEISYKICKM